MLLALDPDPLGARPAAVWQLLVVGFVVGILTVFFDVAYQSYLPALVEREHLVDGNSKLQLTVSVAQIAGPSMSRRPDRRFTAPYAILVDACSFVVSAAFMAAIRKREDLPRSDADERHAAHVAEL